MGQYTSTLNSNSNEKNGIQHTVNMALENQRLRNIIIEIRHKFEAYSAEKKLQDEKYNHELAKIDEMLKNPKPYQYTDPVEAEFERPILKNTQTLQEELQKFAEFITGNMDAILASPEITNDDDETMFAQLVNSAGFECARAEVAKHHVLGTHKPNQEGGLIIECLR